MVESAQGQLRGAKPPTRKSSATAGGPFAPGNEFEDWFAAEREIDAMLAPQRPGAVSGQ